MSASRERHWLARNASEGGTSDCRVEIGSFCPDSRDGAKHTISGRTSDFEGVEIGLNNLMEFLLDSEPRILHVQAP